MACLVPIAIRNKKAGDGSTIPVPCGKCPNCRDRRMKDWQFRLMQEDKRHSSAHFVTFTYELPPIAPNGLMTLDKTHVQKFFKRLRKNTRRQSIRYYACGEYGGRTWRPHYHAVVFDASQEEIIQAWEGWEDKDASERLRARAGHLHFGDVGAASVGYVLKYMCKPKQIPRWEGDSRIPEFSLMSKGMGENYLTPAIKKWHHKNLKNYVVQLDGLHQALPRYYRDRLFCGIEKEIIAKESVDRHMEQLQREIASSGGAFEYYRNQHAAVKAAMKKYQSNHEKRDKI